MHFNTQTGHKHKLAFTCWTQALPHSLEKHFRCKQDGHYQVGGVDGLYPR